MVDPNELVDDETYDQYRGSNSLCSSCALGEEEAQAEIRQLSRGSAVQRVCAQLRSSWIKADYIWIALSVLVLILLYETPAEKDHQRFFVERNPSLSFPDNPDSVSNSAVIVIGFVLPFPIIVGTQVYMSYVGLRNALTIDLLSVHIGYISAHMLQLIVVEFVKKWAGRMRPCFFALCNYKGYADQLAAGDISQYLADTTPGKIGDISFCLADKKSIEFGMHSFPSGHSSVSFTGMTFIALMWYHSMHFERFKGIKSIAVLLPLFVAAVIAVSRTRDYKHNYDDVLAGSLIGVASAMYCFSTWLPHGPQPRLRGALMWGTAEAGRRGLAATRQESNENALEESLNGQA